MVGPRRNEALLVVYTSFDIGPVRSGLPCLLVNKLRQDEELPSSSSAGDQVVSF